MHAVSNASVLYFCSNSDVKPAARSVGATGVVMLKTSKSDGRRKLGHGAETNSMLFDLRWRWRWRVAAVAVASGGGGGRGTAFWAARRLNHLAMPSAEAYMNMWFPSLERGGLP